MSNHGRDESQMPSRVEASSAEVEEALQADRPPDILGATRRFPRGRLTNEDEGEIVIRVAERGGVVVIDFGKPVTWIGFSPDEARQLADLLSKHARAIDTVYASLTVRGRGRG